MHHSCAPPPQLTGRPNFTSTFPQETLHTVFPFSSHCFIRTPFFIHHIHQDTTPLKAHLITPDTMSSRPRRSAAQKASVAITDMADRDSSNMSSSRSRRAGDGKALASVSRGGQDDKDHTYLTVKLPTNKLRQATTSRNGSSISVSSESAPRRPTRGNKKSYVVDDSDDDEDDEEGEDEIQVCSSETLAILN